MTLLLLTLACSTPTPAQASLASLSLTRLDGTPLPTTELTGKAILFVNVASKCGYTPQYAGLEALYKEYGPKGLVIVGTPCNQFGSQEPGSPEEIATFCTLNYGVTFPLLEKQDVNGKDRSPLHQYLVNSPVGGGSNIGWNFEKFLVDRNGTVVGRYPSKVAPDAPELKAAIETVLSAP